MGYITRGKGVSVHSASCSNVVNLMFDPERRIDVEWDGQSDQAPYVVRLTMRVEDRKGMLAEISSKVSNINTNITNMEAHVGDDRQARIEMTVEIRDVKHLDKVIKSIKGIDGVLGVERTTRQGVAQVAKRDSVGDARSLRNHCNRVDLDADVTRQACHLHRGASGRRVHYVARVHGIHRREIVQVGQENRGADHVFPAHAGRLQQRADVAHRLIGLRREVAVHDLPGAGIQRDLTRDE